MNTKRIAYASLILLMFGAGCAPKVSDKSIRPISAAEVMTRSPSGKERSGGGGVLLMDTRQESSFAEGHLPGAKNLRLKDISGERRDPRLEGYKSIIVYAENPGSASAVAMTKRLLSLEYRNVFLMEEGYEGWTARGLPVESSR